MPHEWVSENSRNFKCHKCGCHINNDIFPERPPDPNMPVIVGGFTVNYLTCEQMVVHKTMME